MPPQADTWIVKNPGQFTCLGKKQQQQEQRKSTEITKQKKLKELP